MIQIKGSVISDAINAVKKRHGDQVYNQIISRIDDDSKQIFNQVVFASSWYPLDAFIKFLEADIELTANGNENALIGRSETLFENQLKGIYKVFVKFGSPEFMLNRISIINQRYFKGVSIHPKMEGSHKAIIKYVGFEKKHRLIELNIWGFYKKAMEISGAENIQLKYLTSLAEDKGFCELEITWSHK